MASNYTRVFANYGLLCRDDDKKISSFHAWRLEVQSSVAVKDKAFFFTISANWLLCPQSLLIDGFHWLFPLSKSTGTRK